MESLLVFLWAFRGLVVLSVIIVIGCHAVIRIIEGTKRPKYRRTHD